MLCLLVEDARDACNLPPGPGRACILGEKAGFGLAGNARYCYLRTAFEARAARSACPIRAGGSTRPAG